MVGGQLAFIDSVEGPDSDAFQEMTKRKKLHDLTILSMDVLASIEYFNYSRGMGCDIINV